MNEIIVNEVDLVRARESREALLGALDSKRPTAWSVYGYPSDLKFSDYLSAYTRGGAGHGAIHRLLDACWDGEFRIKSQSSDKELPAEKQIKAALKKIRARQKLRDLDRRQMIGRFSAMIYRVRDGKNLIDPMGSASELVDIVAVDESQIKVEQWDSNPASERYMQPVMWQYRARSPSTGDTQGQPDEWQDVHWSRVQVFAEGVAGPNFFEGVPLLRAGFNSLVDLEKIQGGSAEGYLKNASRTLVFEYAKDTQVQAMEATGGQSVREAHNEMVKSVNRNIDSAIAVKGGTASALQTNFPTPKEAWEVAAQTFAASVQIPSTILFGQQTGRLASNEDRKDFNDRIASRRSNELTPMLEEFVSRMQAAGIFPVGEFEIEWPPLGVPSEGERIDLMDKLAKATKTLADAGFTQPLVDINEIRRAGGYEDIVLTPFDPAGDQSGGMAGDAIEPDDDENMPKA